MTHALTLDPAGAEYQAATDALLEQVAQQRAAGTFDPANEAVLAELVERFADKRGMKRLRLAETLGEIGDPAVGVLSQGLAHHANPMVRRAAAKTLALIANPASIPVLVQALLGDGDTVVHGSCAGALTQMGRASAPVLLELLEREELPETTKGHVSWALAFLGEAAKEDFYGARNSASPAVRAAVVAAIAKVAQENPEPRDFEVLVEALGDDVEDVRLEAASVLGILAHRPAVPNLLKMLEQDVPASRKAAALALMKIGDRSALEPLNAALAQEENMALEQVMQLAITQLSGQGATVVSVEADDWGEENW
ncbi:MAG: HEAT repeat domain-containing protein [Synechococcales cyanobacterium RM1_1_8]|nr:HEAT repeat domain-containing protein [Synechococcales cyanobacterium RM1_1_8]